MLDSVKEGKVNVVIDGQFGSTGKGLLSSYVSVNNHIDICVTNGSPNAGHTFYWGGKKCIVKHLPVSGVMHKRSVIYLCAGAIINPKIFLTELQKYNVPEDRVFVHPRAAVITREDIAREHVGACVSLSSTQNGVGSALARKIMREAVLAEKHPVLTRFVREFDLEFLLEQGCTLLIEVPQGVDLSINSGLAYPYCTSREITVSQALSDIGVHPSYLGTVYMTIRTFPIRVGNLKNDSGKEVGESGPFYPDSKELTWEDIGVKPEYTTNTKRIRRVATFSKAQYKKALRLLRPDYILLNFANYLNQTSLKQMLEELPEVTHVGFGPTVDDVKTVKEVTAI